MAYVKFNLNKLEKNIDTLLKKTNNINFLFPVKCCTHESVLKIVSDKNLGFDISNKNEFNIIKKYLKKQFVSVSGPLSYELENTPYNNLHIVANNLSSYKKEKGIRVNLNSNNHFDKSRFGVDYKILSQEIKEKIKYIHFHNSDHKTLEKVNYIQEEIKQILTHFKNVEIINIGGHLEDLTFEDGIKYLNNIREIVPENINLYVELGDFLFKEVGTLYAKVIDVRKDIDNQIVTLDFSKMANQRWAYPTYQSDGEIKTSFYGCSCCETDIYLETKAKELFINDEVIFKNISPYSYQWDISFNGVEKMNYIFEEK